MTRMIVRGLALLAAITPMVVTSASAQVSTPPTSRVPFAIRGEASVLGELYGISGREPRRPGSTGRVLFQPTLEFSRYFKVGVDLQLTTEGSGAGGGAGSPLLSQGRQRLNQLGISPTWSWGTLHLGDFTDTYTPLTFSGVRVRGAGAAVNPGLVRLAAFRGQAQSAVFGSATNASYARTVAGGRVGIGRENGSFVDLILVRTWDDAGSLPPPDDTAFVDPRLDDPTVDPDTLPVGTLLNPLSVTPQENVVTGFAGRLHLFDQRLRLEGEVAGAAYSRDVRAGALDNDAVEDEIPGLLRGLFTPRIGSSFGLAYTLSADVRARGFAGGLTLRRVDPGFAALGVASLLNDLGAWEFRGTQRLGRTTSLRLDAARQHDNLVGQKAFTTNRTRYGGMLNLRPLPRWSTSLRLQYVGMNNNLAADDARWIAYGNWIASSNHAYSISRDRLWRSVGWSYTYRHSGDDNPARAAASLTAHAANVRLVLAPTEALSVTPSLGWQGSSTGSLGWRMRETYGIASQLRLREGRWTSSLSLGGTEDRGIGAIQTRLSSRYELTRASALTASLRDSRYRNAPNAFGAAGNFSERTFSVQLTHRLGDDQ